MVIPSPYFRNTPYGDLKIEQILEDYDYPLLSVLLDNNGKRCLCMCFDVRESQQWLITPISDDTLVSLLNNETALEVPFKDPRAKKLLANLDYMTKEESFQLLDPKQVPDDDFPNSGDYLDSEEGEWDEYIERIKSAGPSQDTTERHV